MLARMLVTYVKLIFTETFIILRYSLVPAGLNVLLWYVNLNYTTINTTILLLVYLHLVHNEDQRTGSLRFRFIIIKIAVAVLMFYFAYQETSYIYENYLPNPNKHAVDGESAKLKVSKPRAKSMLLTQNSRDVRSKLKYHAFHWLLEYLIMCTRVALFRLIYLSILFIINGIFQFILWCYLQDRKQSESDSDDSSDSDNGSISGSQSTLNGNFEINYRKSSSHR